MFSAKNWHMERFNLERHNQKTIRFDSIIFILALIEPSLDLSWQIESLPNGIEKQWAATK